MGRAGYVLAGGQSTRMGTDKGLLPYRGRTLIKHVTDQVRRAAGSVSVVGDRNRYETLGIRVIPDLFPGCGPLAGVHAALSDSASDWNLIVACDMPAVPDALLEELFREAEGEDTDCVVPLSAGRRAQPLCAVYHRRCSAAARLALEQGHLKMTGWLDGLRVGWKAAREPEWFVNANTPEEWACHLGAERRRKPERV